MFQHFLITRFSCRRHTKDLGRIPWLGYDPLDRQSIEFRLRLLEIICLPSLLGQTNQDFDWIIVIDKDLSDAYRQRLTALCHRQRTHSVEYHRGVHLARLGWLRPLIKSGVGHVLTTTIDDDDALPRTFVAAVRDHVERLASDTNENAMPPFKVIACKNAVQWDLISTRRSPMGTTAPWHRRISGERYSVSCGFSLLCRYPDSLLSG